MSPHPGGVPIPPANTPAPAARRWTDILALALLVVGLGATLVLHTSDATGGDAAVAGGRAVPVGDFCYPPRPDLPTPIFPPCLPYPLLPPPGTVAV